MEPPSHYLPLSSLSGKFKWKEETNTLEWISNDKCVDKFSGNKKKVGRAGGAIVQDSSSKKQKTPSANHRPYSTTGRKPLQDKSAKGKQSNQNEYKAVVELIDVKIIAVSMLSEVVDVAIAFEELIKTDKLDLFFFALLRYFYLFFEKSTLESKPVAMYIEPSRAEVAAKEEVVLKMKYSKKFIGAEYCNLLLGINLEMLHHMGAGLSRVSATYSDRRFYETLYDFCIYMIWITFKRRDFEGIRKELGRILRSDTFNPSNHVKIKLEHEKNEASKIKIIPSDYRRQNPPRPPLKDIITQKSPIVVSIMPSPKEEAQYLFDRRTSFNLSNLQAAEKKDNQLLMSKLALEESNAKLGILGDYISLYNPQTLAPIEDEIEDEDNNEKKNLTNDYDNETQPPGTEEKLVDDD